MGVNIEAQDALDRFFTYIGDEEKISWYPSAGCDYRDLVETRWERLALRDIDNAPNIICHTDYNHRWTNLNEKQVGDFLYESPRTCIQIIEKHRVMIKPDIAFDYDGNRYRRYYQRTFDHKPIKPLIYFMNIKLYSNEAGELDTHVFFFIMENYHFLEELVLKHKLSITHFVKVRQGCGFGGCYCCISVFYSLLGYIGVNYLIVDEEIHYSRRMHDSIALRWNIQHKAFRLMPVGEPMSWSGYTVRIIKVEKVEGDLDFLELERLFSIISPNNWFRFIDEY